MKILWLFFVVLLASCKASSSTSPIVYAVGDLAQGGYVFEANSDGSGKACTVQDATVAPWEDTTQTSIGITAQSITDGAANTEAIVLTLGNGTTYSARQCDLYAVDSEGNTPCLPGNVCYDDWYLPALSELSDLYNQSNLSGGPVLNFSAVNYFSSTELSASTAQGIDFNVSENGIVLNKNTLTHSRCVRSF